MSAPQQTWLDDYMTRCHTMLAHISTLRTEVAKRGLKSWGEQWRVVEPHLDGIIADFLRDLATEHRKICRVWIDRWLTGKFPGNDVLKIIASAVNPT